MRLSLEIKFERHTSKCPKYVFIWRRMTSHGNKANWSCLEQPSTKVLHDNKTKQTSKVRWELRFFFCFFFPCSCSFSKTMLLTHFTASAASRRRGSADWVWLRKSGYRPVNIAWFPQSQRVCLATDESHSGFFFFLSRVIWWAHQTVSKIHIRQQIISVNVPLVIFNLGVKTCQTSSSLSVSSYAACIPPYLPMTFPQFTFRMPHSWHFVVQLQGSSTFFFRYKFKAAHCRPKRKYVFALLQRNELIEDLF